MLDARKILIRRADESDLQQVLDVLQEAAEWMLSRGINQWPRRFPTDFVIDSLRKGETYLAFVDSEIAGTITLKLIDSTFWPGAPDDALYVHRIAIRRRHQGLGTFLLDWAEHRARAEGKEYLRLDCWYENRPLRDYYEKRGFEYRDVIQVMAPDLEDFEQDMAVGEPWNCALYEKRIAQQDFPDAEQE